MASKFSIDMDAWARQAEVKVKTYAQEFINDMAKEVVTETPVDTGFLRASWDSYLNDPSAQDNTRSDPDGSATIANMSAKINGIEIGDTVYILNSANYASALEFGTKSIAPRAFVRGTLAQAPRIAKATADRIRRMKS